MVENQIIKKILATYDELQILREEDDIVFFRLKDKEYGIWYSKEEEKTNIPFILVKDDSQYDYPHIMQFEIPIDEGKQKYRSVCLHESGDTINYLMSYEEKIIDTIDRLIQLVSLSPLEIEEEFQKEFLYCWNEQTKDDIIVRLYIASDRVFQNMNVYQNKDGMLRAVTNGINLNNKDKWDFVYNICAFYIPITDNRRILPPVKDKPWEIDDILKIIKGRDVARISHETYKSIKKVKVKSNRALIVFEMMVLNHGINFCCLVYFKNSKTETLMDKLENSIQKIEPIKTRRCDYFFLNKQIGNDTSIVDKNIAIVGVGSLGSYLSTELVKSGIKNLTIYDDDTVEEENIMRHRAKLFWSDISKAMAMKFELESMHPEIIINPKKESITQEILKKDMSDFDMIIFTVGSSDVQLMANTVFKEINYDKPVIYSWLEAGGTNSHILKVDYSKKGCFECLYTNEEGNLVNNKANKLPDELVTQNTIRNGCGATRVAYGTEILLRTTCVILDTVKRIFRGEFEDSCLIDIEPTSVINLGNTFKEGKCQCCGDRDS
ncbi:ThiF family adenylyltransferase [Clostridium sp. WLY-B-L2]|uniref:ThiF family adenylyltransferase n=1 Tax=Clostridium aromativorans TaxID=2836848 RepID=A0ABS8N846_9CLOT|nr:ThiF family adenylyltransferase [Clostridium aromativorans]MCC9295963.1 ThiF family adenylyltransferase [Clostridium aromativorans]